VTVAGQPRHRSSSRSRRSRSSSQGSWRSRSVRSSSVESFGSRSVRSSSVESSASRGRRSRSASIDSTCVRITGLSIGKRQKQGRARRDSQGKQSFQPKMYLDEQMNALAQRGLITSQEDEQAVQDLLRSGNVEDATRTLCGCAPGQATVEIEILVDGCPLPTRDARGEGWKSGERWTYAAIAPAQESREFAVRVHNRTTRLLGVELSIDGAVQEGCRRWAVKPGEARVREGTSGRYYAHRRFKFDRARFIPCRSSSAARRRRWVWWVGYSAGRPASAPPLQRRSTSLSSILRRRHADGKSFHP
jgi:hypothetical protein